MPSLASTTGAAHGPVPAPTNPPLPRRTQPASPPLLPATINVNLAHEARSIDPDRINRSLRGDIVFIQASCSPC
jgi:hypothetical protein